MKTRLSMLVVMLSSLAVLAAPPPGPGPGPGPGGPGPGPGFGPPGGPPHGPPGQFDDDDDDSDERAEQRERRHRMMMVMGISDALELTEAETIKLSERMKAVHEKRQPVRKEMGEAMKALRDAAQGDQAALAKVDANVQKVLDGRAKMATLDKELFGQLAQGLNPQKKAKLALALGRMNHEMRGGPGRFDGARGPRDGRGPGAGPRGN